MMFGHDSPRMPSHNRRAIAWYDSHAMEVAARYERLSSDRLHEWLIDYLPEGRATVLDVGAGSGRDAAWLAGRGYEVVATEPSSSMLAQARSLHANSDIQWESDRLPDLKTLSRSRLTFDFILLSAVWMHVPPEHRSRAFRKLINLLRPGGIMAMTLRHGPVDPDRCMYDASWEEVEKLAREHGAYMEDMGDHADCYGRKNVHWTQMIIRLPTDNTGALPLLRHLVLNDSRSSTYKLGLLRALCRIADGAMGLAHESRDHDKDFMVVPLGLVALTWLRLYMPLIKADLPQSPNNEQGHSQLGFAKQALQKLSASTSHLDLRVGIRFQGERARLLHKALKDAVETIVNMPARYLTYPNEDVPIFETQRRRASRCPDQYWLDEPFLSSFGDMRIPTHLWRAMQQLTVWIEPAIMAEWEWQIKRYAKAQGRPVDNRRLATAMIWADPQRDVGAAKKRALDLMRSQTLHCVWSGKRLKVESIDIDHCFPWSVWPCSDLWNLMPTDRRVNQNEKRAQLPSGTHMKSAQQGILHWWHDAYTQEDKMKEQFWCESQASLPLASPVESDQLDQLFRAISIQRIRLQRDQKVPEWAPGKYIERLHKIY